MNKKLNKKEIIGIVVLLIIIPVFIAINIDGSPKEENKTIENQEAEIEGLKTIYINACQTDTNREYCACTFDYFYNNYGIDGMQEIMINLNKWGYDERANIAVTKCSPMLD